MTITREQLELAARAMGLQEHGWMGDTYCHVVDNTWATFDPLTDHGQLLDLAMACGIGIRPLHGCIEYLTWSCGTYAVNNCKVNVLSVDCQDFSALAEAVITAAAEQQLVKEGKE